MKIPQSDQYPNQHVINAIITANNRLTATICATDADIIMDNGNSTALPRSELDSHANMIVLGKHCFPFESTGKTCSVKPFSSELGIAENVPIIDGAIAYEEPYTGETFILLMRNALYIPTMDINLIPPFILRAGGVIVNDVPKIHCNDPMVTDHCISFRTHELTIPLQLQGTFSFFHHRVPTMDELHGCDKIFITPDASSWNPHCDSFSRNEQAMTDYEGNIVHKERRPNFLMKIDDDDTNYDLAPISALEWNATIDTVISSVYSVPEFNQDPNEIVDDAILHLAQALSDKAEISKFCASIGCCDMNVNIIDDDLFITSTEYSQYDDSYFSKDILKPKDINSTTAGPPHGITKANLAKIWTITELLAAGVIDQTTQLNRHNADNSLSRHLSTNDRMLSCDIPQQITSYTNDSFTNTMSKVIRQVKYRASNYTYNIHEYYRTYGKAIVLYSALVTKDTDTNDIGYES